MANEAQTAIVHEFVGVWGNWNDEAAASYDPEICMFDQEHITEENGYSKDDIQNLQDLKLNHRWRSEQGNHYIIRIKNHE